MITSLINWQFFRSQKRLVIPIIIFVTFLIAFVRPAQAGDELERDQLARIANELKLIEAMVEQAQRTAQSSIPTGLVQFRYDWLQRDLRMIRQGIEQHMDAPRQPRPVPPLRGDYRF